MEREKLLDDVAPCALLCYTCTAYEKGPVLECAGRLYNYLIGFGEMRGTDMEEAERGEWLRQFEGFHSTLKQVGGVCPGCRRGRGGGCIVGCVIPDCVKERGLDFCADCGDFPCQNAKDFFAARGGKVGKAWEAGTLRLKALGLEAYFAEKKDVSHYIHYKEE